MKKARIYILPTTFGAVFVLGATVMILVGAAYQNNLVNMLAFFMLSLIFTSMIQTHNNLKGLKVIDVESDGSFAKNAVVLSTILSNETRVTRFNIETSFRKLGTLSNYDPGSPLLGKSTVKIKTSHPTNKRGLYNIKDVCLSTVYPLGLFRAWLWIPVEAKYHVYPEPIGNRPIPFDSDPIDQGRMSRPKSGDDFHGHRNFEKGESQRRIDWKAYARGRPLLVKEFSDGAPQTAAFDWYSLSSLDSEERLSQLSAWIDESLKRKIVFSMKIPGFEIQAGQGRAHALKCWQALAAYNPEQKTTPAQTTRRKIFRRFRDAGGMP